MDYNNLFDNDELDEETIDEIFDNVALPYLKKMFFVCNKDKMEFEKKHNRVWDEEFVERIEKYCTILYQYFNEEDENIEMKVKYHDGGGMIEPMLQVVYTPLNRFCFTPIEFEAMSNLFKKIPVSSIYICLDSNDDASLQLWFKNITKAIPKEDKQ